MVLSHPRFRVSLTTVPRAPQSGPRNARAAPRASFSSLSRLLVQSTPGSRTQRGLVKKIAALEGGSTAVAVLHGHAAQLLAFSNILQPGDHGTLGRQFNSLVGRSRSAASKTLRVWFVLCVMFSHLFCAVPLLAFGQDVQLCIGSLSVKLTVSRC